MSNDFTDLLAKLQVTTDEQEHTDLLMEFTLGQLSPRLRAAVQAMAIPHWFDPGFLGALLDDDPLTEAEFAELTRLSFVEAFPGRGYDVHERSRTQLLAKLWQDAPEHYRRLSWQAAEYAARQDPADTAWRVESVYHRLVAAPEEGVEALIETGWE
jgi:hypothetical protein